MAKKDTHTHNHTHARTEEATDLLLPSTELKVRLSWSQIAPVYDEVLKQMAKRVKNPGFRPGKVPPIIAKDIIGEERLKEETANRLLPDAYQKALTKSGKLPLTQPEFRADKIDDGSDWEFTALIAGKPNVEIKGYQKVVTEAKKTANKELAELEKTKKATPSDSSTAATDSKSKPSHTTPNESEKQEKQLQAIYKALVTTYKPRVPELLLKHETRAELEDMARSLEQLKLTFDDYLARRQISFEQLTNEVATQTLGRLQLDLLYSAIIDDQQFKAEEADVNTFLERITDEKAREAQKKDERYLAYVRTLILRDKVSQYLLNL